MELGRECLPLLPGVCLVLADPKLSPPDDSSLEKLLDWFKDLQDNGLGLFRHQPCISQLISSICTSKVSDPAIFTFILKLTGLLAATKEDFLLLEEEGHIVHVFVRDSWTVGGLWVDASVRSGWLQGLLNMLKHHKAVDFICGKGFIQEIVRLQNDRSLFVASLANQLSINILNHLTSTKMSCVMDAEGSLGHDWLSVSSEIINGVAEALRSEDDPRILRGLRLVSLVLCQCAEPVTSSLWKEVLDPLESLILQGTESLTQPLISVLQSAVIPVELKRKAVDFILLPLQWTSVEPEDAKELEKSVALKEALSQKASCVSLLVQSLLSLAELAGTKYSFDGISIPSIAGCVMAILKICSGNYPALPLHMNLLTRLIGCWKVQRCGLDALGALSTYEDVFGVLLKYLQSPDSHATVLKKAFQATLSWIAACSSSSDLLQFISQDIFPVLEKRMCDVRWEVRDSALEFITQLIIARNGDVSFSEALHNCGMVFCMLSSLADTEGYVRASAVTAVGEAEQALNQMMTILSQDTEGFPRRAVVKTFTSWLKGSQPIPGLDSTLSTALSLGNKDFDWEVKMHTLELAEVLIEKTLISCLHSNQSFASSEETHVMQGLSKLYDSGLLDLLLNSLFDCDRPVCEKACSLLLRLQTITTECDQNTLVVNVCGKRWEGEVMNRYYNKHKCLNEEDGRTDSDLSLSVLLQMLDLEDMQRTLNLSSDHVVNSPRSLMEDILSVAQRREENIVDCY
ncbi:hypothetical protein DNTS_009920 [Danionella cerebrum]|uniref:BRCA1-associated ATM activator 1 n=1 Tax=Danionella cerebrum TaxID=2873325 RepID=A0A553PUZ6_9TELE|nr:hypothetical protein DNTS_009920 [Danionella translucida]TRY81513.1 hypothetical protein DNTS_009920 [Danionella translucida]